ncbi:MAG TPA: sugar transferase [Verrucomicrobiae bacterium]|nr:sugar transferase [Verrucomicrobiae bacterium]
MKFAQATRPEIVETPVQPDDTAFAGPNDELQTGRPTPALPLWKRALDLSLLLVSLPGLLLVGSLVALIIKLGSRGPVFFRQKRVGYKGREFVCYKFRTMVVNAETASHQRHTQELIRSQTAMVKLDSRRDPRLIPLGSLLRSSGLDELPQLLNVLRGEMSVVGPRPCIRYECDAYEPWHWQRFDAVPGLTGLWQVSGKNRTTFNQMVRLDIEYSQRLNFWLDLQIIVKTLPALWRQYCDVQAARRPQTLAQVGTALESFSS